MNDFPAEEGLLAAWWRRVFIADVDHDRVITRIKEESGFSARFAFMIAMSAGIAVLGLLLSSPAVVIGAMLISPLMNPILGLGFGLTLFDFSEVRRALAALVGGAVLAVAFTALIVMVSPLKEQTAEILARTRPNLFDLLVALFAALAGSFAIIRGRGETIVGVAIATALMPPLAVVGYGLATWNLPVLGGSLALFVTNFVTIALVGDGDGPALWLRAPAVAAAELDAGGSDAGGVRPDGGAAGVRLGADRTRGGDRGAGSVAAGRSLRGAGAGDAARRRF